MMGPCPLIYGGTLGLPAPPLCELLAAVWAALGVERRDVKAAMLCETPSANMNCSRSSMLVRPLAVPLRIRTLCHTHHTVTYRESGVRCVFWYFFFFVLVCVAGRTYKQQQ